MLDRLRIRLFFREICRLLSQRFGQSVIGTVRAVNRRSFSCCGTVSFARSRLRFGNQLGVDKQNSFKSWMLVIMSQQPDRVLTQD